MKRAERDKQAEQLTIKAYDLAEKGQIALAVKTYRRAARMGFEPAMNNLGNLLDDTVRPSKPMEAVYWYKRAVRRGSCGGAYNLAVHYKSLGQRRWQTHWLKVAAKLGDPDAKAELRKLKQAKRQTS